MRSLNYQAVLDRVYRHFVIDRQPPGIVDGVVLYHQTDHNGNECPCAIGLFDTEQVLDHTIETNLECPYVDNLYLDCPELLADVFEVDSLSRDDVHFLQSIQGKHDYHAMRQTGFGRHAPGRFAAEMADALERMATVYGLNALAF